ncbi:MAG TPA: hypothetical protein DCP28_35090 [Cytophagales bacterium]|nr:hypothetical protein [Cytophagales bacterium]
MSPLRIQGERKRLERLFKNRYNFDPTKGYAKVSVVSSGKKKLYVLEATFDNNYPFSMPTLYLSYPKGLRDHHGQLLSNKGLSHSYHTLGAKDGKINLCYQAKSWNSHNSLADVFTKGKMYTEALELHQKTGKPISHYL